LAEAEALSRARDQFLMSISHELRTPLTAVSGWVSMLRRFDARLDAEKQKQGLAAIERGVGSLARIIGDLLDYSRIMAGKFSLNRGAADLAAIAGRSLEAVGPSAEEKGVVLEAALDSAAGSISADAGRLEQAIWNLLSNAVKFTPAGGRVRLRLDRSRDEARISVTDTGRGLSADARKHLFERFWQSDAAGDAQYGGMGLGLTLVRHFVEAHGGTVSAESPGEGRGTTFTLRLPVSPPQPDAAAPAKEDSAASRA
jgi:signal transduction histidine kinase